MRGFKYLDVVRGKKSKNVGGKKVEWIEGKRDLAEPPDFFYLKKKKSCEKSAAL